MRPICFSNEHIKMHWQTKVGGTHTEFTICYKSQKYFQALSSSKSLFDKEDLVKKKVYILIHNTKASLEYRCSSDERFPGESVVGSGH